jgi:hypothetical protein
MDNVLARKARNIRARAANILAIDDYDALPSPANVHAAMGRTSTAAENHEIKFFRLQLLKNMGGWRGLGAHRNRNTSE